MRTAVKRMIKLGLQNKFGLGRWRMSRFILDKDPDCEPRIDRNHRKQKRKKYR